MADNTQLNAGSGGDLIATDEIAGVKHQRVKVQHGADGSASDVSAASPLPVDVRSDNAGGVEVVQDTADDLNVTEANSAAIRTAVEALVGYTDTEIAALVTAAQLLDNCISGSEAQVDVVSSALPTGAATSSKQDDVLTALANLLTELQGKADTAEAQIVDATGQGDVPVTLDGEDVTSGTADNFKADANVQVGDADASVTNPLPTNGQLQSSYLFDGTTRCEVKRTNVVTSTDGADLIAAVAGKKFRVLAMSITATAATVTNAYLEDSDGTDVFGSATGFLPLSVDADGDHVPGLVLPWNPGGWFQTPAANKDLHIKLSAAQVVVVTLTYIEVA